MNGIIFVPSKNGLDENGEAALSSNCFFLKRTLFERVVNKSRIDHGWYQSRVTLLLTDLVRTQTISINSTRGVLCLLVLQ
eukprot:jgi/Psemu1/309003/fgenesh1_kg.465_\